MRTPGSSRSLSTWGWSQPGHKNHALRSLLLPPCPTFLMLASRSQDWRDSSRNSQTPRGSRGSTQVIPNTPSRRPGTIPANPDKEWWPQGTVGYRPGFAAGGGTPVQFCNNVGYRYLDSLLRSVSTATRFTNNQVWRGSSSTNVI